MIGVRHKRLLCAFVDHILIGYESSREVTLPLDDLAKELVCSFSVASALHKDVKDFAVTVYSAPEVMELSSYSEKDFVHMPDVCSRSLPFSERPGVGRTELEAPVTDRFVGDSDTTIGENLFNISVPKAESVVEADGLANNFFWISMSGIAYGLSFLAHSRALYHA